MTLCGGSTCPGWKELEFVIRNSLFRTIHKWLLGPSEYKIQSTLRRRSMARCYRDKKTHYILKINNRLKATDDTSTHQWPKCFSSSSAAAPAAVARVRRRETALRGRNMPCKVSGAAVTGSARYTLTASRRAVLSLILASRARQQQGRHDRTSGGQRPAAPRNV